MKLALLNTSIITSEGSFTYRTIRFDEALSYVGSGENSESFIGHDSTAVIMSELLGFKVPVSRVPFKQEAEQNALVFKPNGRPPEGRILSRDEIESIGYTWGLLTRTA